MVFAKKKVQQRSHKKAKLLKLKRLSSFLSFYGTQFQNEVENILGARAFCWQNNSLDEQSFQKKKLFFQHTQQVCSAVTAKSFYFFSSTSFQQTRLKFLSFKSDEVRTTRITACEDCGASSLRSLLRYIKKQESKF